MCDIEINDSQTEDFIKKRFLNKKQGKIAIVMVGGPGSGKSSGKQDTLK
jgi:hypothetical protein